MVSSKEKNPKRERGPAFLLCPPFHESRDVGPRSRFGFFSLLEDTLREGKRPLVKLLLRAGSVKRKGQGMDEAWD